MDTFWNFICVIIIAWVTQKLIAWRETDKKLKEEQLHAYLTIVKPLSFLSKAAAGKRDDIKEADLFDPYTEIITTLALVGTPEVINAFLSFSWHVSSVVKSEEEPNEEKTFQLLDDLSHEMRCDIYNTKIFSRKVSGNKINRTENTTA